MLDTPAGPITPALARLLHRRLMSLPVEEGAIPEAFLPLVAGLLPRDARNMDRFLANVDRFGISRPAALKEIALLGREVVDPSRDYTYAWPTPEPEAFTGLAGHIVKTILPYTEADAMALLAHAQVYFGNLVGREAWFQVGSTPHYPILFAVVVGESNSGRKGTAAAEMARLFNAADPDTWDRRLNSGAATGEGLIELVRDARYRKKTDKNGEDIEELVDAGADLKNVIIYEGEFAAILAQAKREGNILSAVIRKAWDASVLQSLVKGAPTRASNAAISIIGDITPVELIDQLTEKDIRNGFGNRFLWPVARMSKELPIQNDAYPLRDLEHAVRAAVGSARGLGRLRMDDEAEDLFRAVYSELKADRPGRVGALSSRGAPQVLRLGLNFALFDADRVIRARHLRAGLAVWRYNVDSLYYLFGDQTGDEVCDRLLTELRNAPDGLPRAQLGAIAGNPQRLFTALVRLQSYGLARPSDERGLTWAACPVKNTHHGRG